MEIEHVRPHGAMYKMAAEDFGFACAVAKAIKKCRARAIMLKKNARCGILFVAYFYAHAAKACAELRVIMSKIYFRRGTAKTVGGPADGEDRPAEHSAAETFAEDGEKNAVLNEAAATEQNDAATETAENKANSGEAALNAGDKQSPANDDAKGKKFKEYSGEFDKEKIIKYFRRHPKNKINTHVERYSPDLKSGLSSAQVQTRFTQFLFNDTNKKYSKSYASIFVGNICTFFNLLCLIAFIGVCLLFFSRVCRPERLKSTRVCIIFSFYIFLFLFFFLSFHFAFALLVFCFRLGVDPIAFRSASVCIPLVIRINLRLGKKK